MAPDAVLGVGATRRHPLALAVSAVLLGGGNLPAVATASTITADTSRTDTTVTGSGDYEITTTTSNGDSAFNAFTDFFLAQGDTAQLVLPDGTRNLINLVYGNNAAEIHGELSGMLDGAVGGHLVFAASNGVIVGSTGVINAGALTAMAPSENELDRMLEFDSLSLDDILQGNVELNPDAIVDIGGTINADHVRLIGHEVVVQASGQITVADPQTDYAEVFGSAVNVEGLEEGTRLALAEGGIVVSGRENVDIQGSLVVGENGGEGGVVVRADNTGESLLGGLDAAERGVNASVAVGGSIDAGDITVVATSEASAEFDLEEGIKAEINEFLPAGLEGAAEHAIDEGIVALEGELEDEDLPDFGLGLALIDASSNVTLEEGADLSASGNVDISARTKRTATAEASADGDGLGGAFSFAALTGDTGVLLEDGSEINAAGDVRIEAESVNSLTSEATTEVGDGFDAGLGGSVALGFVHAGEDGGGTTVEVEEGARLSAGGDLALEALTTQDLAVESSTEVSAGDTGSFGATVAYLDVDWTTEAILAGLDEATSDEGVHAEGALDVIARTEQAIRTEAHVETTGDVSVGLAAAIAEIDHTTRVSVDGTIRAGGDILLLAESVTSEQHTIATTSAPDAESNGDDDGNGNGETEEAADDQAVTGFVGERVGDIDTGVTGDDTPGGADDGGLALDIGAAVAFTDARDATSATLNGDAEILPPATQSPSGNEFAIVSRRQLDDFVSRARSGTESTADDDDDGVNSINAAVSYASLDQTATTSIAAGASVEAGRIGVGAEVELPARVEWGGDDGPGDIGDIAEADADDLDDWLTTEAGTSSETAGTVNIAGAVNYLDLTAAAEAMVGSDANGADPTALAADEENGDWQTALDDERTWEWADTVSVDARSHVETIDSAGQAAAAGTAGIGGGVNWSLRKTSARALVADSAEVTADAGGIAVTAERLDQAIVLAPVAGESGGDGVGLGAAVAYASLNGESLAEIGAGALVEAAQTLRVAASGDSEVEVAAHSSMTGEQLLGLAGTVAFADVDTTTRASIVGGAGSAAIEVGELVLHAVDMQAFTVDASAEAEGSVAVGLAGAVLDTATHAEALLDRDVATAGDVVLIADAETTERGVSATTTAETGSDEDDDNGNGNGGGSDGATAGSRKGSDESSRSFVENRGERGNDGVDGGLEDFSGDGSSDDAGFAVSLGAAVAFTDAEDAASARIGEGVTIDDGNGAAAGDVVVVARRAETGYRARAQTEVEAEPEDDSVGVGAGAALTLTFMDNRADALIGADVVIEAGRVGVAADVVMPDHFEWPQWDGLDTLRDFLQDDDGTLSYDEAEANLIDMADGWLTTYANAAASSDDGVFNGAAAVNYASYDANASAWIGEGAAVSANDAAGSDGWDTEIRAGDNNGDDALTRDWADAITVAADADIRTIDVAGNVSGLLDPGVGGDATVGIGAGFAWLERGGEVTAGIADHAVVTATHGVGTVGVHAERFDQSIGIAPSSGHGASFAGNGTVVVNRLDTQTVAAVANTSAVEAAALGVTAGRDLSWWSVAGSITLADSVAVGIGVAVNDLATDTRALIGGVGDYVPSAAGTDNGAALDDADVGIVADHVTVSARTDGLVGSASIAGSAAGETGDPIDTDGWNDSGLVSDVVDGTAGHTEDAEPDEGAVGDAIDEGLGEPEGQLGDQEATADDIAADDVEDPDPEDPDEDTFPDEGAEIPSEGEDADDADFGVAIAGSASVNLSALATSAEIVDARIDPRDEDTDHTVSVAAIGDVDTIAASGSGALVLGGNSSDPSVAIAGTVAVNLLGDNTRARIVDTDIADAGDITVEALRDGELISVGMGLAITANGSQKGAAVAGSVSLSDIGNTTSATVEGGSMGDTNGDPHAGDGSLRVLAYDRSSIGTGGGSLFGGKGGGLGAAVTLARVSNDIHAGIHGAQIAEVATVDVEALSASRIISAAAVLGYGGKGAVGGAVVLNRVDNNIEATIADREINGDWQRTDITAGDHVRVRARSASDDERAALDDRIEATARDHGYNFNGEGTALADPDTDNDPDWGDDGYESGDGELAGDAGDQQQINNEYASAADDADFDGGLLEGDAIVGVAGSIAVSGKASVGLAFSGNDINNDYVAEIRGAEVDVVAGEVSVDAADRARIIGLGVGGGASGKVAIAGSGAANRISGSTRAVIDGSLEGDDDPVHLAEIDAGTVQVSADRGARIDALAGSVAFSSKAGIGAAIAYNEIDTAVGAGVRNADLNLDGDLDITASSSAAIYGVAVSGGGGGKVALNGSAIVNMINLDVAADLEHTRVRGADAVRVQAGDANGEGNAEIWSLAGAINGAGKAALGAAVAYNEIGSDFHAGIADADIEADGPVEVAAAVEGDINTLGAAGGGAGKVALGGAATVSIIDNAVSATLADSRLYAPDSLVAVTAAQDSRIRALGASIQGGGKVGGGAAVTVNDIGSRISASVRGGTPSLPGDPGADPAGGDDADAAYHVGHLWVDAASDSEIQTIAAGLAGGGAAGVAGSISTNLLATQVEASVHDDADVVAEGHVLVDAASNDEVQLIAGSLGFGGKAFGGAGTVGVNIVESRTLAWIGGEDSGDDTRVEARAGTGSLNGRDHTLDAPALVDLFDDGDPFDDEDDVEYYDSDHPGGSGNSSASGIDPESTAGDFLLARLQAGSREVDGVRVSARSDQATSAVLATAGISANVVKGGGGLAATALINHIAGETGAGIRNATVESGADVEVTAGGHVHTRGLVIGAALGSVGAAGAADVDLVTRQTRAAIDDAEVTAADHVRVDARGTQSTSGMAIGASGGTYASLAGGGVVSRLGADIRAEITGDTVVEADEVAVNADSDTAVNMLTGTVAVSGVAAVAGSFNVAIVDTTTIAGIGRPGDADDPEIRAADAVTVDARSRTDFGTLAASGSAGGAAAVAGTLGLSLQQSETEARIAGATVRGREADEVPTEVTVSASDELHVGAFAGGASLGLGMGIGAAANVFSGQAAVRAQIIDGADVSAHHVDVTAEREADLDLLTATLGAGGTALSAGVGVILLGHGAEGVEPTRGDDDVDADDVNGDLLDELDADDDGSLSQADQFVSLDFAGGGGSDADANTEDDVATALSDEQKADLEDGLDVGAGNRVREGGDHETVARIDGSSVTADTISVSADDRVRTRNLAGSGAIGGSGFGGAVAFTRIGSLVVAEIGGGSGIDAEVVDIDAHLADLGNGKAAATEAWAGAAGLGIGLAAAYSDAELTGGVRATLGPATLEREDDDDIAVNITATDGGSVAAEARGAAVAGVIAGGAAIARGDRSSDVIAEVADNTAIGDADGSADINIDLEAVSAGEVIVDSIALGGALAGSGAAGLAFGTERSHVQARVGDGAELYLGDGVLQLEARANPAVAADGIGAAAALGIGIGAAVSRAYASAEVDAGIGNATVVAREVDLDARSTPADSHGAYAEALAGSVAKGAAISGAFAFATDTSNVRAGIGAGADITLGSAGLRIIADADPAAYAETHARTFAGGVAFGANVSMADSKTQVTAEIGDGATVELADDVDEADVTLLARANTGGGETAYATGEVSGGALLVSANGGFAGAYENTSVDARIGNGARIDAGEGEVRVDARATPRVNAELAAKSYGGGLAIGAAITEAEVETAVLAALGDQVEVLGTGDLGVRSRILRNGLTARARSAASSGALASANAGTATARNAASSRAVTGTGVTLPGGVVTVRAESNSRQDARAESESYGAFAAGLTVARAESNTVTHAILGADNRASDDDERPDVVDVSTAASSRDHAHGSTSTGGAVDGAAAEVYTASAADNLAEVRGNHGAALEVGLLSVRADQETTFSGVVDTSRASIAGASGGRLYHNAMPVAGIVNNDNETEAFAGDRSRARARIGDNAEINALFVDVIADHAVERIASINNDIRVAGGGVVGASAGRGTTLVRTETRAGIGAGSQVSADFDIRVDAREDITAEQVARLNTGNAIDIARAESVIDVDSDNEVYFGNGSQVTAGGNLLASSVTSLDIVAHTRARTSGVASFARGNSEALATVSETIRVAANANLASGENLVLRSGVLASGSPAQKSVEADTYLYNKGALPLENDPRVHADLTVDSDIEVDNGAVVQAGENAMLMAPVGFRYSARGEGEGQDIYRRAAESVANFFRRLVRADEVSLAKEVRSQSLDRSSRINIDGQVIGAGGLHQYLWVRGEDDVLSSPGLNWFHDERNVREELEDLVDGYQDLLGEYVDPDPDGDPEEAGLIFWRAAAQIETLAGRLDALGGEDGPYEGGTEVPFIEVEDVLATGGDVMLRADEVGGSGEVRLGPDLDAVFADFVGTNVGAAGWDNQIPDEFLEDGGPSIRILSESHEWLQINDLVIDDQRDGSITIFEERGNLPVPTRVSGSGQFNGLAYDTGGVGGTPDIRVVHQYEVPPQLTDQFTNPEIRLGQEPDPQEQLEGGGLNTSRIINPRGLVQVANRAGSIISSASIEAATVEIVAGGNFVQNWIPGFFHAGGLPEQGGDASRILAGGDIYISAEHINVNGLIQSGVDEWRLDFSTDLINAAANQLGFDPDDSDATLGEYLEWYGKGFRAEAQEAQAVPFWAQVLPSWYWQALGLSFLQSLPDPVDVPDEFRDAYNAGLGGERFLQLTGGEGFDVALGTISSFYDADADRIDIQRASVGGGYIFLAGDIVSTGGGEIRALSGFGEISVDTTGGGNDRFAAHQDIVIYDLDAGTQEHEPSFEIPDEEVISAEGLDPCRPCIRIWDLAKRDDNGNPIETIFQHDWNTVAEGEFGRIAKDVFRLDREARDVEIENDDGETETVERFFLLRNDVDEDDPLHDQEGDAGEPAAPGSTSVYRPLTGLGYAYDTDGNQPGQLLFPGDSVPAGLDAVMLADESIHIEFIGNAEGTIDVRSLGDVIIDGSVRNPQGITMVESAGSILEPDQAGLLQGRQLSLLAGGAIGSDPAPLRVIIGDGEETVADSWLQATAADGGVFIDGLRGDLPVREAGTTSGHTVSLDAADNLIDRAVNTAMPTVYGAAVHLRARDGAIGRIVDGEIGEPLTIASGVGIEVVDPDALPEWQRVPLGSANVTARAAGDVYLAEDAGDLAASGVSVDGDIHVESIRAAEGDVFLFIADGKLINALDSDLDPERVERLAGVWDSLGMTGDGVGVYNEEQVEVFEASVESRYQDWWELDRLAEEDGSFDLEPDRARTYAQRAGIDGTPEVWEDDVDANTAAVNDFLAQRYGTLTGELEELLLDGSGEQALADLGTVIEEDLAEDLDGGGMLTYERVEFTYEAPPELVAELEEGAEWTEEQLFNVLSEERLLATTDTQYQRVETVVQGENVTVVAPEGSIGSADEPIWIDAPADLDADFDFTDEERAALVTAQPGDIQLIGQVELANGQVIDLGEALRLLADDGAGSLALDDLAEVEFEGIQIEQVRTAGVAATDGWQSHEAADDLRGDIFLGAAEAGIVFDRLWGGGDIRVRVADGITITDDPERGEAPADAVIRGAAGGLLLEAANGGIGAADLPVTTALDPRALITARAAESIHLRALGGNLTLNNVFSEQGDAVLVADQGHIARLALPGSPLADGTTLDILAEDIELHAGTFVGAVDRNEFESLDGSEDPGALSALADVAMRIEARDDGVVSGTAGDRFQVFAPQGGVTARDITAGGRVVIGADEDVELENIESTFSNGEAAFVFSENGFITGTNEAGRAQPLHLRARGDNATGRLIAPLGIATPDDFLFVDVTRFSSVSTLHGSAFLHGITDLRADLIDVPSGRVELRAPEVIDVDLMRVHDRVDLKGDDITATIQHTANPDPLPLDVVGLVATHASDVDLHVTTPADLMVERLYARRTTLTTNTPNVFMPDNDVRHWLDLQTPWVHLWADNLEPSRRDVDVQLYQPTYRFFLEQRRRTTFTDAYSAAYSPDYRVRLPNYLEQRENTAFNVEGRSIVRDSGRLRDRPQPVQWPAPSSGVFWLRLDDHVDTRASGGPRALPGLPVNIDTLFDAGLMFRRDETDDSDMDLAL